MLPPQHPGEHWESKQATRSRCMQVYLPPAAQLAVSPFSLFEVCCDLGEDFLCGFGLAAPKQTTPRNEVVQLDVRDFLRHVCLGRACRSKGAVVEVCHSSAPWEVGQCLEDLRGPLG